MASVRDASRPYVGHVVVVVAGFAVVEVAGFVVAVAGFVVAVAGLVVAVLVALAVVVAAPAAFVVVVTARVDAVASDEVVVIFDVVGAAATTDVLAGVVVVTGLDEPHAARSTTAAPAPSTVHFRKSNITFVPSTRIGSMAVRDHRRMLRSPFGYAWVNVW
ncbi:MAG: hypothetical protein JWM12_4359 [Ilumatobacteraceae bacterium]|nr:hypothetical protein [Ilumatobacteraceae bacterium]